VSFLTGPEGAKIMATVGRQNSTRKATTPKAALQEAQQAVQKDVASLRKKR
jgi:hypothetical protein